MSHPLICSCPSCVGPCLLPEPVAETPVAQGKGLRLLWLPGLEVSLNQAIRSLGQYSGLCGPETVSDI